MNMHSARRAPSLAHRAEYAAARAAIGALGWLPWTRAVAAGERLGMLAYRPFGIRAHVVERQIAAAFPDLSPAQVRELARASYAHLGRVAIETALLPSLGREGVLRLVTESVNEDVLHRAVASGRGVVCVTGHVGNWELCGSYVAARGIPLDAVARGMSNPLFDAYLGVTRLRNGITVVHDREAVRRVPRAFLAGRAVAFVADQGVLNLASTYVPFFGRPAKTPRGPAVFAIRFGVPMIFGAALRRPDGRYRAVFEEIAIEPSGDRARDVDALVSAYTRVLERWVRAHPEQYFWQHRRWKRQPPDTPPALRDPAVALDHGERA